MIGRPTFWMGLVWLSMPQAPHAGLRKAPASFCDTGCGNSVSETMEALRGAALRHFAALKSELRAEGLASGAGDGEGEAAAFGMARLAGSATTERLAP